MSYIKILQLGTLAGLSGCLCANVPGKWKENLMRVNAQPQPQPRRRPTSMLPDPGAPVKRYVKLTETIPKGSCPQPTLKNKFPKWFSYEDLGPIFPHPELPTRILLENEDYVICYDKQLRLPLWTLELMTKEACKKRRAFPANTPDLKVESEFQSTAEDYCSVRNKISEIQLAHPMFHKFNVEETIKYSNVVPQMTRCPGASTLWDELNDYVLHLSKCFPKVYVLSGPLFLPVKGFRDRTFMKYELFGHNKLAVPTHFFKAILIRYDTREEEKRSFRLECYKFKNEYTTNFDLRHYQVERCELERDAGFDIFGKVDNKEITHKQTDPGFISSRHKSCPQNY